MPVDLDAQEVALVLPEEFTLQSVSSSDYKMPFYLPQTR